MSWKGMEPWPKCAVCKCSRRPSEVKPLILPGRALGLHACTDSDVCKKLKRR